MVLKLQCDALMELGFDESVKVRDTRGLLMGLSYCSLLCGKLKLVTTCTV